MSHQQGHRFVGLEERDIATITDKLNELITQGEKFEIRHMSCYTPPTGDDRQPYYGVLVEIWD